VRQGDSVELTLTPTTPSAPDWIEQIDYWAVDFGERDAGPFHVDWYAVRTKRQPDLPLRVRHEYGDATPRRPRVRIVTADAVTTELTLGDGGAVGSAGIGGSAGDDHSSVTP
jgi:hypothetical protein